MHRSLPKKSHMFEPWPPSPNTFTAHVRCIDVALVTIISTVQKSRKSNFGWPRYRQNSSRMHTPYAPAAVPAASAPNACLGACQCLESAGHCLHHDCLESFRLVGAPRGRNSNNSSSNNTQNSACALWFQTEISSIKWSRIQQNFSDVH